MLIDFWIIKNEMFDLVISTCRRIHYYLDGFQYLIFVFDLVGLACVMCESVEIESTHLG